MKPLIQTATIVLLVEAAVVFAMLVIAATGCVQPNRAYIEADAATYNAVAGEWLGYVEADSTQLAAQKADARELVHAWGRGIEIAAEDVGLPVALDPDPDSVAPEEP